MNRRSLFAKAVAIVTAQFVAKAIPAKHKCLIPGPMELTKEQEEAMIKHAMDYVDAVMNRKEMKDSLSRAASLAYPQSGSWRVIFPPARAIA